MGSDTQRGRRIDAPPQSRGGIPGSGSHAAEPYGSHRVVGARKIADQVRAELEKERSDPAWQKKLNASRRMRERKQAEYEKEFREAVLKFLAFDEKWSAFAEKLADAVTAHAVPVGSGTVARTQLIPLEQRAEAAVIAWMRHQTTAYDRMSIARSKGNAGKCAARLAERSRQLLAQYRSGGEPDTLRCPLARALCRN